MVVAIINGLFRFVEIAFTYLINIFPVTPFSFEINLPEWARWVGILIPYREMAVFMTTYIGAVMTYYIVRVAARWIKLVGS